MCRIINSSLFFFLLKNSLRVRFTTAQFWKILYAQKPRGGAGLIESVLREIKLDVYSARSSDWGEQMFRDGREHYSKVKHEAVSPRTSNMRMDSDLWLCSLTQTHAVTHDIMSCLRPTPVDSAASIGSKTANVCVSVQRPVGCPLLHWPLWSNAWFYIPSQLSWCKHTMVLGFGPLIGFIQNGSTWNKHI